MTGRPFSVILLPTSGCNVACDYCFENKSKLRLSPARLTELTGKLLDHMERSGVREAEIYWQGGEVMLLPPEWYEAAFASMTDASAARGRAFRHYLQTNLIAYSERWNPVIAGMFGGEIGTSMDFPNAHRKLFNGSAGDYTQLWLRNFRAAKAAGFQIGVIAVIHPETLEAGADAFWHWFVEEAGVENFQINTPFPGGPASDEWPRHSPLDMGRLTAFTLDLLDLWIEHGIARGIRLGPFDGLVDHFSGRSARLPCIWQENCASQFISIDAKGSVAQCDCWVTSYDDWLYGNVFEADDLTRMLRESPVRERFLRRPKVLVQDSDCLACRYLSICHGGCPVRAFTATGHIHTKDPYCEMYKSLFARVEETQSQRARTKALQNA